MRRWAVLVIPPLILGAALVMLWQAWVVLRDIEPYLMPSPSAIWTELRRQWSNVWEATTTSGANALIGLIAGTVLGVVAALIASRFRFLRDLLLPLAAAFNVIPIVAAAPILANGISNTSELPRRIIVSITVFFPIFINTLKGLTQIDPTQSELMRALAASPTGVLRKVRVPNSLGYFFTGLKIASASAVIAAIVAEYFGGPQNGLGSRISSNAAQTKTAQAWSYVVAACVLGLIFYISTLVLERLALPWRAARERSLASR